MVADSRTLGGALNQDLKSRTHSRFCANRAVGGAVSDSAVIQSLRRIARLWPDQEVSLTGHAATLHPLYLASLRLATLAHAASTALHAAMTHCRCSLCATIHVPPALYCDSSILCWSSGPCCCRVSLGISVVLRLLLASAFQHPCLCVS
jgi:hypothetical protein